MEKNVGSSDRAVRIVLALGLVVLIYVGNLTSTAAIVTGIIAAALLVSAVTSRSLVYRLAGIDTTTKEGSYSTTDDRAGL